VRIENNLQTLNSNTIPGDTVIVNNNITRTLPSVNIAYNLTDRHLIRAAYGKTLNRPEFREIAPLYFYDFVFNSINTGNPDLKTPSIDNYDLRFEFYPRPGENITFGAFYKRFMNPIEVYFVPGIGSGGTRSFTWANAYQAQNYGLELEIRKKLDSINVPVIRNLSVIANASIIKSVIDLNKDSLGSETSRRPMMGQSPWIVNAGLYYQNDSIGLQVNAMYNVIGPRVVIVGIPDIPAVWEMPRHQLDISVIKTFGRRKNIDVRVNVTDVLNRQFLLLQDANEDGQLNRQDDQALQFYKRGTYVTFGITLRLLEPKQL
jgi:outer membrane receptor protein involved in Fe transport